ncbi:CPBP family intramembrane metalloprotease [Paenibacillus mesophilus]|uniref:CPBP family intramembrane glutamic endopeptidase n=1 Tax=Paenibacillus mesophilus TaxID=2582849 RepID=UPI00110F5888|nr:CPBP family intramembrane glutamic endopeptidase [Paenibacillus mesophilus]TMV46830.1 CPBP family intramembrane metalloprotease [Paenibacillus mesophilus]
MKGWTYALVVPIIPLAAGFGLVWLAGLSSLVVGGDFQGYSWAIFPFVTAVSYIQAVLTQSMGEELGWRGYLLPVMMGCMSKKKAMLLNGLIHGVWHFPIIPEYRSVSCRRGRMAAAASDLGEHRLPRSRNRRTASAYRKRLDFLDAAYDP